MSVILPINTLIVPEHVTRGYLERYTEKQQQKIETLYQQIKAEAISNITDAPKSGASVFVLVAGSQGVGKSQLVERLQQERAEQYVVCDVEDILKKMPEVQAKLRRAEADIYETFHMAGTYDAAAHVSELDKAVEEMRPAAKYINDRLAAEAVAEGHNVIFETNAKTPFIKDFIDCVKKTGAIVEAHICEAPERVKRAGAVSPQHGLSFPEDIRAGESNAFRKNIPVIAAACDKNLTVWWRQSEQEGLQRAAVGTSSTYTTDMTAKTGFEAYFADRGDLTVSGLMGKRHLVGPRKPITVDLEIGGTTAPAAIM